MAEATNPDVCTSDEDLMGELEALASIFVGEEEFNVERLPAGEEYHCVVRLRPEGLAVGLQFSLPTNYPQVSPKVEILAREEAAVNLAQDDPLLTELLQKLYQSAQESRGEPVMYALLDVAKEWLDGRRAAGGDDIDDDSDQEEEDPVDEDASRTPIPKGDENLEDGDEGDSRRRGKKEKKKKKRAIQEEEYQSKKPRMKTASEVISRIQWDRQVRQEDFTVGYLDRFVGIVEKPFTAFSWVDIATVDDYVTLAIPRHRIQYFKYKDQVVWDKNQRIDNVFGSTGSNTTILDTVQMFSKENQNVEEKETSDDVKEELTVEKLSVDSEASSRVEKKRQPRQGANYFFSIRITDPVILRCVRRIQDAVCDWDPRLEYTCIDDACLHITLCTMRLESSYEKSTAIRVLQSLQQDISSLLSPLTMLRFQGLGQFSNRILYSPPEESPALLKLSQTLLTGLRDAGINLVGNRDTFNPHLTLMKMNWANARAFDGMPIHLDLYKRFEQAFIGVQPVDAIHLCSMDDPKRADGFYYCLASMDVQYEH